MSEVGSYCLVSGPPVRAAVQLLELLMVANKVLNEFD